MAENRFFTVLEFMVSDLKLKGNQLLVYAIIYGFSQDGKSVFKGSLGYLAKWTNSTKKGVSLALNSLIEKDYIKKKEKFINGIKYCEYRVTKFHSMEENTVGYGIKFHEVGNKVPRGMEQSSPNNIYNNIEDNIEDNIVTEKPPKKKKQDYSKQFELFWNEYPRQVSKQQALKAFEKIKPNDELLETMIGAIRQQKATEDWQKDNGKFIPYPTTWLNNSRWEDKPPQMNTRTNEPKRETSYNIDDFEKIDIFYNGEDET